MIKEGMDGACVNRGNRNGATPLFIAAQKGHATVVRCIPWHLSTAEVSGTHWLKPCSFIKLLIQLKGFQAQSTMPLRVIDWSI
eukprot:725258-Amphidinium_carterae.2